MNQIETNQRLNEILFQLGALRDHLQLVEKQIAHKKIIEKRRLDKLIRNRGLSIEDSEVRDASDYYNFMMGFHLPLFLRNTFLVSLYAVYESTVTDVADMMKERQSQSLSMSDLRGNLLEKALKYYNHILKFDLYVNEIDWNRIKMLLELRNAVAHSNSRIDMIKDNKKNKISAWESQKIGLSFRNGYIIIEEQLAESLFASVRSTLINLRVRYQKWKGPNLVEGIYPQYF